MVAFDLGKLQSEFDAASPEDRAYAIATHRARKKMEAYEQQYMMEHSKGK